MSTTELTSDRPPSGSERPIPWRPLVLSIALIAVAARLYLMVTTHRTVEDFYITLRYVENLAHGAGFVYNPGERVLGTTTPLYTLLLALFARLGLDPVVCGKLVTICAAGIAVWLIYRLGAAAGRPDAGALAASLFAVWPVDLLWSISGMETTLVATMGLAVFVALAERRPLWMAVCAALLVLLRVDGLLLVLIAFGALWRAEKRFPIRATALFLILIAPWTIFATLYFGSPIPTSVLAKLTVYSALSKSAFPNLKPFAFQMAHNPLHFLMAIGAIPGLWLAATRLTVLRPAALWLVLFYASLALSKVYLFGWYFDPPGPVHLLFAALGWIWIVESLGRRLFGRRTGPIRSTLLNPRLLAPVGVIVIGLILLPHVRTLTATNQVLEERLSKDTGLALRGLIPPGARLMLEPIGYIGYFSGARILDAVGLVSPEVLPYYRRPSADPYLDMIADMRPDYVLLRTGEYHDAIGAHVPPDRALLTHYTLIRTFANPVTPQGEPALFLFRRKD